MRVNRRNVPVEMPVRNSRRTGGEKIRFLSILLDNVRTRSDTSTRYYINIYCRLCSRGRRGKKRLESWNTCVFSESYIIQLRSSRTIILWCTYVLPVCGCNDLIYIVLQCFAHMFRKRKLLANFDAIVFEIVRALRKFLLFTVPIQLINDRNSETDDVLFIRVSRISDTVYKLLLIGIAETVDPYGIEHSTKTNRMIRTKKK